MAKLLPFDILMERINKSSELFDKEFSGKQLGIGYHLIRNWKKQKLIPFNVPESKWLYFSFLEACWINMINDLRKLGFPISSIWRFANEVSAFFDVREMVNTPEKVEAIQKALGDEEMKKFLAFTQTSEAQYDPKQFASTEFGLMVINCIITKSPMFVLISAIGDYFPVDKSSLEIEEFRDKYERFKQKPHISISINHLIATVLLIPSVNQQKFYNSILSDEENELIKLLRSNSGASKINIRLNTKKTEKLIDLIELEKSEKIDPLARVTELFLKDGYEEVSLITEKGIIKSVKRKRKIKL